MNLDCADYGEGCADYYDEIYAAPSRAALDRLTALAAGGPVLEAGIATGRYALPLAARGLAVHGIDASPAMLSALRRKPGAERVSTTLADFSAAPPSGRFRLIICLTDTLALLPDATQQARAIAHLAEGLGTDGRLLIETTHEDAAPATVSHTDTMLHTRHGQRRYRVRCCSVHPELLDRWAAAAHLQCEARWGDWRGRPWNGEHGSVLSLYRRTTPA